VPGSGVTTAKSNDVGGFSCTIGSLTFSSFSFSSAAKGNSTPETDGGVTVTPIITAPDGFTFTLALSANNSSNGVASNSDATLSYVITGPGIDDLELAFNGTYLGTGTAEVSEDYCLNAATVMGCSAANSGAITVVNPPGVFDNTVTFAAPVSEVAVSKDIQVNTGSGANSEASISQVSNQYSQVPEPGSLIMLGSGLIGLVGLRRSKLAA